MFSAPYCSGIHLVGASKRVAHKGVWEGIYELSLEVLDPGFLCSGDSSFSPPC